MSDDGYTPRSGRKKKSALSKLAARNRKDDSDEDNYDRDQYSSRNTRGLRFADEEDDTRGYRRSSCSKYEDEDDEEDIRSPRKSKYSSSYTNSRYTTDDDKYDDKYSSSYRKSESSTRDRNNYPVDADVEVRPVSRFGLHSNHLSDSDEGIEMGSSSLKGHYKGRNTKLEPLNLGKDSDDDRYNRKPSPRPRYQVDKKLSDHSKRDYDDSENYKLSEEQDYLSSKSLTNKYRTTSPDRKYGEMNGRKSSLSKYEESYITSKKYDNDSYTKKYDNDSFSKNYDNDSLSRKYDTDSYPKKHDSDSYTKSRGLYGKYKLKEMYDLRGQEDEEDKLESTTESDLRKEYESLLRSSKSRGLDYGRMDEHEKSEYSDKAMPLAGHSLSPLHKQRPMKKTGTSGSLGSGIFSTQDHPWSAAIQNHGQDDEMSQGSTASTSSALQTITTKAARQRGFLMGSMTGGLSLMGQGELERFFPDRKLRVLCGTWNMCEMKAPQHSLDDFLLPESEEYLNHIYVIGTQESMANRKEWEVKLQESLGPQHCLYHSAANGVLYLSVFMHRDLLWYCSEPHEASVSTKKVKIKTKGAIAIAFTLFGTSFLFINSHLSHVEENVTIPETAHDGMAEQRCADYHKICSSLQFPSDKGAENSGKDYDVTALYDVVFWCGDLNFRLEKERDRVHRKVEGIRASEIPTYEDLVETDELFRVRNRGLAFQQFQEGRINFRPTYKYDLNSDEYDTKKLRIPSYTDRILFRTKKKNAVTCLHYDSVDSIKDSDHRPVYGNFEVNLRPGKDISNMNAGRFNREIYMEGTQRRAENVETGAMGSQKASKMCVVQ